MVVDLMFCEEDIMVLEVYVILWSWLKELIVLLVLQKQAVRELDIHFMF